jgi:hypothetical protein
MSSTTQSPLFSEFTSVTILLTSQEQNGEKPLPTQDLTQWILRFHQWFVETAGIRENRNLHLLYGRNLNVLGPGLLALADEAISIGAAATETGMGYLLQLDLKDCLEQPDRVDHLLESGILNTILLDSRGIADEAADTRICNLAELLVRSDVSLVLLGPISFWQAAGVLDSPMVNATNFQLMPGTSGEQTAKLRARRLRERHPTPDLNPSDLSPLDSPSFDPCAERLHVYVTADGWLYPCQGLVGVASCALGTIYDPIEATVLSGRESPLDFISLAKHGPRLPGPVIAEEASDLPPICFRHRQAFEE